MTNRLKDCIRLMAVAGVWLAMSTPAAAGARPNVLFLLADDQCYETVRAFGLEDIDTPHLDRLAKRGTTFTHAYNMGSWSGAVCVASRTMLNTGRFVWHARAVYDSAEQEREAGRWWSESLKAAGYRTYMSGKWHVKANAQKSFDVTAHVRPGMPPDTAEAYNRPLDGQPDPWSPTDPKFAGYWQGGRHWSEVVADDAVGFLAEASGRAEPFFMYIAFNAPHDPRQSPQEFIDHYPLERMQLPVNFQPEYPFKIAMGCGPDLRDEKLAPFPRTERAVKVHRQEYYAIITHLDQQVGRILEALDASGKADSTWVFYTADHGLAVGRHGLFGKQNQYDHSVRVPFIAAGPGVPADEQIDASIYLQDVMPTTLELAGVERPEHVDFRSLLPLLRGERDTQYEAIYGGYLELQRAITHEGYKLILYPQASAARLYHVAVDPHEQHDLAGKEDQRPRLRRLFAKLQELQAENGDPLDLRMIFPALQ